MKHYVYCNILRWKELKVSLLMRKLWQLFLNLFAYCHYEGCQKCEKYYKNKKNICSNE